MHSLFLVAIVKEKESWSESEENPPEKVEMRDELMGRNGWSAPRGLFGKSENTFTSIMG